MWGIISLNGVKVKVTKTHELTKNF